MTGKTYRSGMFWGSVTGTSHLEKGLGCEDASGGYVTADHAVRIAAVADGHGDHKCVRSGRGAKLAVRSAVNCLQVFSEHYPTYSAIIEETAAMGRPGQDRVIRQLTDAVLSEWTAQVKKDLQEEPLTAEEYIRAGERAESFRDGQTQERTYGTTLLAALQTGDYLLILQQGDGRCDLLYEAMDEAAGGEPDDASCREPLMRRPLPEDERCHGNVTTSLSDVNAAEEIRGIILTRKEADAMACILATDGVDNGFYEEDALKRFYLELYGALSAAQDPSSLLEDMLQQVSADGNGDDVSIAGFLRESEYMMGRKA